MNDQQELIAVLIPCYNEEMTVGKVVADFKEALPSAVIYVFDNNSTDNTAEVAEQSGAIVIREKRRGKGCVVQSMFQKIDADYYVMVDGDDTYPAEYARNLLEVVAKDRADMVVGNRLSVYSKEAFRPLHVMGNNVVRWLVNTLFHASLKDIMSGYRVMNRETVKGIIITSRGFEVETEMTLQCLNNGFVVEEVDVPYRERPQGSVSKLRTLNDGFLVITALLIIFRDYKPLLFFGVLGTLLFLIGVGSGTVVVVEFMQTRYITHVPLSIFAVGCTLCSLLLIGVGLILDTVKNRVNEVYLYLRRNTFERLEKPVSHAVTDVRKTRRLSWLDAGKIKSHN